MSLPARIETVANIATIGVAVVVSVVLIKVYLLPARRPGDRKSWQRRASARA